MSYIILNGINSNTIRGLLIQSLPPITKPLMRTMVEEIDGRPGDIVTPLGFAAYDKEITVGLHGGFDVDEVIAYFDSEGRVTFSSEPDKYYDYQILDQIDFERLIRFRTATVRLHCQPYKYSATESPVDLTVGGETSLELTNSGNTDSKPRLTVYGSGSVGIWLNGVQIFALDLSNDDHITIDAAELEASKNGIPKNRLVIGDIANLELPSGDNTLGWNGSVTRILVENYSRWI